MCPIVIFAFNRLDSLKTCVYSLLSNTEAKDSDLIVFVDGPRADIIGEKTKVQAVQEYVKTINGFRSVKYFFSEVNRGLGPSVIKGVSEVIAFFGEAIVLEDDLVVSKNFLSFMNQGLKTYRNEENVFSICGYSSKVTTPPEYKYDMYFCSRSSSWGWATWKDRWDSVDWDVSNWKEAKQNARRFNQWGGSDCFRMLRGWKEGRNQSWAIRFGYSQFLQNKVSVFPIISKVQNCGFDGSGTNCKKWNRFKFVFDNSEEKKFIWDNSVKINPYMYKQILYYHSLRLRLYSRFMSILKSIIR